MNSEALNQEISQFQDRINRMNYVKQKKKDEELEFIRKQNIRIFINDCDEIRPDLRRQLLKDSKLCQIQQIKDKQICDEMKKDFERAWNDIQCQSYHDKLEREYFLEKCRRKEELSTQEFIKSQIDDKFHRKTAVFEDLNEEIKQISESLKEDHEKEKEKLHQENKVRKSIGMAIQNQIRDNSNRKEAKLRRELQIEKGIIKENMREHLARRQAEASEKEQFRRAVFGYLNDLDQSRIHNGYVDREKEKLIEDIRKKAADDVWQKRCEEKQKRFFINAEARRGQVLQIKNNERLLQEERVREKKENLIFNEKEHLERKKIEEEKWKNRVKSCRYGCELLEQQKRDKLRQLEEKQRLEEMLKLVESERETCRRRGQEFVKSYQDVLPSHPNFLMLKRERN